MRHQPKINIAAALLLALVTFALPFAAFGQTLYCLENGTNASGVVLTTVDRQTAAELTIIGNTLEGVTPITDARGMAMDPTSGTMYFIDANGWRLMTINLSTAAATLVGTMSDNRVRDLAFDSTGQLYGVTGSKGTNANSLISIDKSTGTPTLKTAVNGTSEHGLAFDPRTPDLLYHVYGPGATKGLESISIATNTITPIATSGTQPTCPLALVWDPISKLIRFYNCEPGWFTISTTGVFADTGFFNTRAFDFALAFDQSTTVPVELQGFSAD